MSQTHGLAVIEHVPARPGADSPLVVVVHGSLDRAASFARVTRRLGDLHTVAYDRRGYNLSRDATPLHTTVEGHIDDLLAVVDGRPAVVVGHSYGGVVALGAALRDRTSSPIQSVAAYEPPMPWLGPWSRRSPGTTDGGAGANHGPVDPLEHEEAGLTAERFYRRMVGSSAWDRLPDRTKRERRADGPALAAELGAIRIDDPPFDVSMLTVPSTFGRGERSLPHHRQTVAWLVEHTPGAELVEIPGAAHGAHLTHPDAFAALARSAVRRAGERVGDTA